MLQGLDFAFAYVDDDLIVSDNEKRHDEHIYAVLCHLKQLVTNLSECLLGTNRLKLLGHVFY